MSNIFRACSILLIFLSTDSYCQPTTLTNYNGENIISCIDNLVASANTVSLFSSASIFPDNEYTPPFPTRIVHMVRKTGLNDNYLLLLDDGSIVQLEVTID